MALVQSALFLALVASSFAVPLMVDEDTITTCARTCPAETTKFAYEVGKTYRYAYKSEVLTHIQGAGTERSRLNIEAQAHIDVISRCEMLLRLTDVKLTDAHPEQPDEFSNVERAWEFKRILQQRSLPFAFVDGRVESVCPLAEEVTWALNIKRGILSVFQNTMHDLQTHVRNKENDISGDCYVDYSVESHLTGYKVKKSKDVLSCSGRAHYDSFLQTAKFDAPSRIQSLPLIKTTHECEQNINNYKILTRSSCTEKHVFRPFSTDNSGVTTEVTSLLEYQQVSVTSRTESSTLTERKSLLFEYEPSEPEQDSTSRRNVGQVNNVLTTICQQTEENIQEGAPGSFGELIRRMRRLTPEQLETAHTQVKSNPPCARAEKFFHDAIPSLGTPASTRLIRLLLSSGEVTEGEADRWLTSMSLLSRPTRELLADIKNLLTQGTSFRKATLAVTSLVNNYCRLHPQCGDHREVRDIIGILDESLGYNCAATNKREYDRVLTALKGIGNAGHAERLVPKLNRCILNTGNSMEVKVAAIAAFRRMACTAQRDELVNTYESTSADSELRIAAYLGLMACPTTDIIQRVQRRLEVEQVNQVGSFVWTHLTNLQETASPFKQDIRRIVESLELRKAFSLDKRKFSRNIEWSTFSDSLNAGMTVESNVIWSPKSFLPRSATLNLTAQMFGESLNLVEVGGRAEGLDFLLESIYGPKRNGEEEEDNSIPKNTASRRTYNQIGNLHNTFDLKADQPKASYYVRMFGNEIRFDEFQNFDLGDIRGNLNPASWLELLARRHTIDSTSSGMFLDTAMVVPTVAGLPLRLRTDGTAIVRMNVQGTLDVREIFRSPHTINIEGSVRPSAAIQINSEMSVDAIMSRTGVRMVNTLRTNTLADGRIELRDGGIFNLDVNFPNDRIDLFDANSKFFIEYRDELRPQAMLTEGRVEKRRCTNSALTRAIGLELCGRLSYPRAANVATAPWFPLTGPATVSLILNKRETYRGFHFETRFIKEQVRGVTGTKDIAKISFSTPGSRIDREYTFEYTLDNPQKRVNIILKTPFKNLEFTGSLINTEAQKQVRAIGKIDSDVYDLMADLGISKNRYNTQFSPHVTISIPGRETHTLRGNVLYRKNKKASIDLRLLNVLEEGPLAIKGAVNYIASSKSINGNINLKSSSFNGNVIGTYSRTRTGFSTDVNVEYQKGTEDKHTMAHTLSLSVPSRPPNPAIDFSSTFTSSQWPQGNSDLTLNLARDKTSGRISLNGGLTGSTKRASYALSYTKTLQGELMTLEGQTSLAVPYMEWDYATEVEGKFRDFSIEGKHVLRSGTRTATLEGKLARQSASPLQTLAELSFTAPGRTHLFRDTINETPEGTYVHDLVVLLQPDQEMRLHSVVATRLPRPELEADITVSGVEPIRLEGFVNVDVTNFQVKAKTLYGTDEYSTAGGWKVVKNGKRINSETDFELVYPSRTITSVSTMSASPRSTIYESEIKWDAKKDAAKRFFVKYDATRHGTTPRMHFRTEWFPAKHFDIVINGKTDGKPFFRILPHPNPDPNAEPDLNRDIGGDFTFTSTFDDARRITASFGHVANPSSITTQSRVSWDEGRQIDTVLTVAKRSGWKDALVTLEVRTPYENYGVNKYIADYSLRGNTWESKHRFEWNAKYAEADLTATVDLSHRSIEGGLTLLTSYDGYSRMSVTGKHTDNGQIFNTQAQNTWWDGRQATFVFNMDHQVANGWHVTNNGDLLLTLPIGPYRNYKLNWNHQNTADLFKSRADVELDAEKTAFDLDFTKSDDTNLRSFALTTTFRSPYEPVTDLALTLGHEHNIQNLLGITSNAFIKWSPTKAINVRHNIDVVPGSFAKKRLAITTPFDGYETISLDMDTKLEGEKLIMEKELKWGANNKMSLDGSVMLTFPENKLEVRFLSPFAPVQDLMLLIENKNVDGVWHTTGQFDYPDNQKIEIETELRLAQPKFSIDLKTPFPEVSFFFFEVEHSGELEDFKTKVQLEHNLMGGRAIASLESDVSTFPDMDIKFDFTSPYETVAFIRSEFKSKLNNNNHRLDATFEYPAYKVALKNRFKVATWTSLDEKFTLEYGADKIETGLNIQNADNSPFRYHSYLKTPFEGYRLRELTFLYGKTDVSAESTTTMKWDGSNVIVIDTDLFRRADGGSINLVVTTPFEGYERSRFTFNHQGPWNNFNNTVTLDINGRNFRSNVELLARPSHVKGLVQLSTPYEDYNSISLSLQHDGVPENMKQSLIFLYGDNRIKFENEFKYNAKYRRVIHKVLILTPFSRLSSLKTEFKHTGPLKGFKNEGKLEYNGRVYTAVSDFAYKRRVVRGSLTVTQPQTYTLSFVHKGPHDDFINNIQAELDGRRYSANTKFEAKPNGIVASTNIRTPHEELREVLASLVARNSDQQGLQSHFTVNINDNAYSGNADLKMNLAENDISATAELRIPELYALNISHKGHPRSFENSFRAAFNGESYEGSSSFKVVGGASVTGSVGVKIPQEYSLSFAQTKNPSAYANDFKVILRDREASGNSHVEYKENELTATANLELPIDGFDKFAAEVEYSREASHVKTKTKLELPFRKVKLLLFDLDHESNALPEFHTKTIFGYNRRRYAVDLEFDGQPTDFTLTGGVEYKDRKYAGEVTWKKAGSSPYMEASGSLKLSTPHPVIGSMETRFAHSIEDNIYRGSIVSLTNGEKYFDVEYKFINAAKKDLVFKIREPHSAIFEGSFLKSEFAMVTEAFVNWDTTDSDSNVRLSLLTQSRPRYLFEVIANRPRKLMKLRSELDLDNTRFSHGSTIQWDRGEDKQIVYQVEGEVTRGRTATVYNGNFEVRSPFKNMAASLEHERKSRSSKTVLEIGNIEKLTIIHEFLMREPQFRNFQSDLTLRHPDLERDIKLKLQGVFFAPRSYSGWERQFTKGYYGEARIQLLFANDEIIFDSKLGDASTRDKTKYIATAKLTYPNINIDSEVTANIEDSARALAGLFKLSHTAARDGRLRIVELRPVINKEDRGMNIIFKSPYNEDVSINGILRGENGVYTIDVNGQKGTDTVTANFQLDKNAPLADLTVNYAPDRMYRVYAKYLSASTAQFEAYRQNAGVKVVDSQLAVRLNNSRLIHARAYFRPQVVTEMEECWNEDHGLQAVLEDFAEAAEDDLSRIQRMMKVRFQPVLTFLEGIVEDVEAVLEEIIEAHRTAYDNDRFYIKTVHLKAKSAYNKAKRYTVAQYNKYKPIMDAHLEQLSTKWDEATTRLAEHRRRTHRRVVNFVSAQYDNTVQTFQEHKERFINFLHAPWFSNLKEMFDNHKTRVSNWIKDKIDCVRTHPYIRQGIEWATSIPESQYFLPLRHFHNQMTQHFTTLRDRHVTYYHAARQAIAENFDTAEMRKLQEWFQSLISESKAVYEYLGLTDVENFLSGLTVSDLDALKDKTILLIKNYLQLERTRVTVWDPTLGDYQVEIFLPMRLRNIREFPVEEVRRLVTRTRNTLARLMPDEDWIPWDTIYEYKISTDPQDWLPPFKAHATLAGSQHYMTFDKTFYEFSGECSYLLAHDFIDRNFSVIVNYGTVDSQMTKKSITVLSDGKQVEIFPSYKVTIDNKQTEMPVEFDGTTIVRQGNQIRLDSDKGLTVTCDLPYDRCTVNVTGWYFPKTAGMFGTYNNEQVDELLTSDRRLAASPMHLADSWTVGSKCRVRNNAQEHSTLDTSSTIYRTCAKYFKEQSSPFRICFRQVDNAPFMTMCMNDLSKKFNQVIGETDTCQVSSFYVDQCNRAGVPLRQPRACVSCQLTESISYRESQEQRLSGSDIPQSADVVFVVSQKACNRPVIGKLQKLLQTIEDSLRASGLSGNRYGVVGFAGDGIETAPHSHTIEGQLFNRNLKVAKMIGDLAVSRNEATTETAIDALDMAARYPFRAGVSKNLVLITCETCTKNIVSYADMAEMLIKRDIRVHLITPHDFRMRSKSPKAQHIWGMTRSTVYTAKHINKPQGDPSLRRQTYMPKDLCAALSHETNGAIFNSKKFQDRQYKGFRTVLSTVVGNMATPSNCQICECTSDASGVGQSVCRSCNMRLPSFLHLPKFDDYIIGNYQNTLPQASGRKRKSKKARRQ